MRMREENKECLNIGGLYFYKIELALSESKQLN